MNGRDPTGMWLWPWEKPIRVEGGTPEQRKRYEEAVKRDSGTARGKEIVDEIKGPWWWHGSPVTIELKPDSKQVETERDSDGAPSEHVVIDPKEKVTFTSPDGKRSASPERVVAHEAFGHGGDKGEDDGLRDMNNVSKNENPIMQELGKKPRTSYDD